MQLITSTAGVYDKNIKYNNHLLTYGKTSDRTSGDRHQRSDTTPFVKKWKNILNTTEEERKNAYNDSKIIGLQ